MDVFSDEVDPLRDLPRVRDIEVAGGVPFRLTQHDPHGYWRISRERGQIPAHLSGDYTQFRLAKEAVEAYLRVKKPVEKNA